MTISLITITLSIIYSCFILWCLYFWLRIPDRSTSELKIKNIKVAVIVAARNESANLPALLEAIYKQNYPAENFRLIISEDHSTDDTVEVAESFFSKRNMQNGICLRCPEESKKKAIAFAIEKADAELIITTDADTVMGREWLSSIVQEYSDSGAFLISGPVKMRGENNYFERLQSIEFTGLSGIGASGISSGFPMFCNGANLSFSKKIFNEVNGYENSSGYSGDDTQLMLKIHRSFPGKISFLKDSRAIVETGVMTRQSDLLQQRRRWASKIPYALSPFTIAISILAWLVHAFLLIQLFNAVIQTDFILLILPFTMKILSELFLLKSTGKFFGEKIPVSMIISAQLLYCFYIVSVGLLAPLGKYKWKGRNVR